MNVPSIDSMLVNLRTERGKIDHAISALEAISITPTKSTNTVVIGPVTRRKMSPSARKKLSEAAKARWADKKAA